MTALPSTVSRRAILLGGGALVVSTAIGLHHADVIAPLPARLIPPGVEALVLHGGDAAALAFMAQLRRASRATLAEHPVDLLTREGFASLRPALDRARGRMLVAFMGDAEAVILEASLGIRAVQRRRHARHVLLTAHL